MIVLFWCSSGFLEPFGWWKDVGMEGRKDGWMEGRMDGWMNWFIES